MLDWILIVGIVVFFVLSYFLVKGIERIMG
jgi:hypothetical protein